MDMTKAIRQEIEDIQHQIEELRQSGQCTTTVEQKMQVIDVAAQEMMEVCKAFSNETTVNIKIGI